jgi:DNA invertase Pin-like site-specific DNA recombinase
MVNAMYVRVSDDKLTDDGSRRQDVQRQVERLKPYAGEGALIFSDDAKSAYKEDYNSRPEFVKMLREIKANRVQRVYIESMDRWSRRVVDGLTTLQSCAEHNCTITSIMEGEFDVTESAGWMRSTFALMMAEWASRDKSEKVKNAMDRRRLDQSKICQSCGVVHMGRHPLTCECKACRKIKGRVKTL